MADTQREQVLANIAKLIESGESSVEFDEIKITNRSLSDLLRIERRLQRQVSGRRLRTFSGVMPDIHRGIE